MAPLATSSATRAAVRDEDVRVQTDDDARVGPPVDVDRTPRWAAPADPRVLPEGSPFRGTSGGASVSLMSTCGSRRRRAAVPTAPSSRRGRAWVARAAVSRQFDGSPSRTRASACASPTSRRALACASPWGYRCARAAGVAAATGGRPSSSTTSRVGVDRRRGTALPEARYPGRRWPGAAALLLGGAAEAGATRAGRA